VLEPRIPDWRPASAAMKSGFRRSSCALGFVPYLTTLPSPLFNCQGSPAVGGFISRRLMNQPQARVYPPLAGLLALRREIYYIHDCVVQSITICRNRKETVLTPPAMSPFCFLSVA